METLAQIEKEKYEQIWEFENYHDFSPGEQYIDIFKQASGYKKGWKKTLLDIGCGTGRAGQAFSEMGMDVELYDITSDGVEVGLPFFQGCLWDWMPGHYDYGYCCDVMEHIPPEYTMLVTRNILDACGHTFFSISLIHDGFGQKIDQKLHLSVFPFMWWKGHFEDMGKLVESRDLIENGIFYVKGLGR